MHEKTIQHLVAQLKRTGQSTATDVELAAILARVNLSAHFEALMGEVPGQEFFRGHNRAASANEDSPLFRPWGALLFLDDNASFELYGAVLEGKPLAEWMRIENGTRHCYECGEDITLVTNGFEIKVERECRYKDGAPSLVTELSVPSGMIVCGNDFRDYFPLDDASEPENANYDLNTMAGLITATKMYAAAGMAYGFCGNSDPDIWTDRKTYSEKLAIGVGKGIIPRGLKAGRIITDLWWYCAADADDYEARGGEFGDDVTIVNVKKGVYKVHHCGHCGILDHEQCTYAELVWDREL